MNNLDIKISEMICDIKNQTGIHTNPFTKKKTKITTLISIGVNMLIFNIVFSFMSALTGTVLPLIYNLIFEEHIATPLINDVNAITNYIIFILTILTAPTILWSLLTLPFLILTFAFYNSDIMDGTLGKFPPYSICKEIKDEFTEKQLVQTFIWQTFLLLLYLLINPIL